jgi:uncharacterized membrane protein YkgB
LIDQINFIVYICPKYSHMAPIPFWYSDIKKWTKLTKDSAQLYIAQSDSRLNSTIETANNISNTSDKLFGIITTLLTAGISYGYTGTNCYLQGVAIFVVIIATIALLLLLPNLNKYNICTLGEEPRKFFTPAFIENDFSPDEQYLNLASYIIQVNQSKINHNSSVNDERQARVQRTKVALLFMPSAFLLAIFWSLYWHCL